MQLKALSTMAISLSATAIFAVANVAFADSYENTDNIASISVSVSDNTLDPSDIKTRQMWDEESESFITSSYYDIYDYSNITLKISYATGEEKSYTGTEITSLTAKTETPFIISDSQSDEPWTVGTHTVTCYFGGKSAEVSFTVEESKIQSVTVTPQYDIKFIYGLDGETTTVSDDSGTISQITRYDLEGQYYEINLTYTDGSTARYTNKEIENNNIHSLKFVQPEGELAIGAHLASCYLDGIKADFSFEIIQNSIQKISLSLPDGMETLTFSKDGVTDTDMYGKPYPRFFYDISSVTATVTYIDGTTANMPLGQLCRDLKDELVFDDKQKTAPWETDEITINASIRNIPCTLTINITTENISSLKAKTVSPFEAVVSWDRVFCVGYELWKTEGSNSEKIADMPFGTEETTIKGLSSSTSYKYFVRSYIFDKNGEKKYTEAVSTAFTTPAWNESITICENGKTDSSIGISWTAVSDIDGYIISVNGEKTATTDKNTTSYTIDGLDQATLYTIGVKAYKYVDGITVYSTETVQKLYTVPSEIKSFKTASRTANSVTLKWQTNPDVDGYIINRYVNGKWSRIKDIMNSSTASCTINGLAPGETLKLYIKAFKVIDGKYVYSTAVMLDTLTSPPAVKSLKETTRTSSSSTIKWAESTSADGYIVNIYKNGKWVTIGNISGSENTSYTIKNLSSASSHKIYVKAYKKFGQSTAYSSPTKITVYTAPAAVSGFKTASRTTDSVTIKWNKHSKADGYIINRYENGTWVRLKTIYSPTTTSYTIKGLSPAETQKLYIKAFTIINGKYLFSAPTKLNTLSNPQPVENLRTIKRSTSSVTLKWNKNEQADGYIVNIYENGKWKTIKRIAGNGNLSYTIKGLSPNTQYKLYVKAYKSYGNSTAYSGPTKITVRTL